MISFFYSLGVVLKQTYKDLKYNYRHVKMHAKATNENKFSLLRIYCHMLDKGMNNVNFERGHSLSFFREAQRLRDELLSVYNNDSCFQWANMIIERFKKAQEDGHPSLENHNPPQYSKQEIEEFKGFILNRTSCRNFEKRSIPSAILEEIIRIAVDAPNGCCRQVVRYYITQEKDKINNAIPHIAGITNFSNVQCLVCVAAEAAFLDIVDKNLQFVDASLSAENLILGANLYGIYGTMCNFFQANDSDIEACKKIFHVGETENIVMFIAMGYPISIPQKPVRRNLSSFYKEV